MQRPGSPVVGGPGLAQHDAGHGFHEAAVTGLRPAQQGRSLLGVPDPTHRDVEVAAHAGGVVLAPVEVQDPVGALQLGAQRFEDRRWGLTSHHTEGQRIDHEERAAGVDLDQADLLPVDEHRVGLAVDGHPGGGGQRLGD